MTCKQSWRFKLRAIHLPTYLWVLLQLSHHPEQQGLQGGDRPSSALWTVVLARAVPQNVSIS